MYKPKDQGTYLSWLLTVAGVQSTKGAVTKLRRLFGILNALLGSKDVANRQAGHAESVSAADKSYHFQLTQSIDHLLRMAGLFNSGKIHIQLARCAIKPSESKSYAYAPLHDRIRLFPWGGWDRSSRW